MILLSKAMGLVSLKKYQEAVALYDKVLIIEPNNPDAVAGKEKAMKEMGQGKK